MGIPSPFLKVSTTYAGMAGPLLYALQTDFIIHRWPEMLALGVSLTLGDRDQADYLVVPLTAVRDAAFEL